MNKPKFRAWDTWNKRMITKFGRETLIETSSGFHYVDLYAKTDGTVIASIKEHKNSDIFTNPVETLPLMQYTGLKGYMDEAFNDREEKEVARGDVIDIFWEEWPAGYYQENHMIGVVDLDRTGTAWIIKNGKYDWDNPTPIPNEIDGMSISRSLPDEEGLEEVFLHNFNLTSADITILGNIHENPELLNEVE